MSSRHRKLDIETCLALLLSYKIVTGINKGTLVARSL